MKATFNEHGECESFEIGNIRCSGADGWSYFEDKPGKSRSMRMRNFMDCVVETAQRTGKSVTHLIVEIDKSRPVVTNEMQLATTVTVGPPRVELTIAPGKTKRVSKPKVSRETKKAAPAKPKVTKAEPKARAKK